MPGGDGHSERPVADGVDGLSELAGREIPQLTDDVLDRVRGDVTKVQRLVEKAQRQVEPNVLADLETVREQLEHDVRRLGDDLSAAITSVTDELDRLRRRASDDPAGTGARVVPADDVGAAVRATLAVAHPEVATLVVRLVADVGHPLDLTRALADPHRRAGTLAVLAELADGRLLAGRTLEQFRAARPGRGPLFAPVPPEALVTADGRSRKDVFLAEARLLDPARTVGAEPTPSQLGLLDDYVRRLLHQVEPQVRHDIETLADPYPDAALSLRVKDVPGIVDKVTRMSTGGSHRPARPGYRAGEVVDALGARITVAGTAQLATLTAAVVEHYGDRVLDLENRYVDPKPHNPAYRVVPLIIGTSVGGLPYTFEIQLSTRRASVAADLEHNTVYKPYVDVDERDRDRVRAMQAEAAALDQDETRSEAR